MPGTEWTQFVRREFQAMADELEPEMRNDPAALEEHFKEIVDWHAAAMTTEIAHLKANNKLGSLVGNNAKMFSNLVSLVGTALYAFADLALTLQAAKVFADIGVHFFGYAIDEDGTASMMWGGTDSYTELRETHNMSIMTQLKDYEAMFR